MARTNEIQQALEHGFSGADVNLSADDETGKISGFMIWSGFAGRNFLRRQNDLYRVLRRELGAEERAITHIFTYTPDEYQNMQAVANN